MEGLRSNPGREKVVKRLACAPLRRNAKRTNRTLTASNADCPAPLLDMGTRPRTPVEAETMIRKLPNGKYRLYSIKTDAKTGKRRNLGTFNTRAAALKHE